jgi:glycolate oxidase iron-sulfur subunit
VGCLLDKLFPEVAGTIVSVLAHHDMNVFIPQPQGCCGIPMLSGGDREAFSRLVRYHLDLFGSRPFDYLVTGCATCTAAIKKLWPAMAGIKNAREKDCLDDLAQKTYDISWFLVNIIGTAHLLNKKSGEKEKETVTYHDPCHLRKTLGIYKEPRMLIGENTVYSFKEMPEATACCGMGGSFSLSDYATSTEIGLRKIDNIKASGASIVATGCPACMVHISDMLAKTNSSVAVRHIIEIYADGRL